MNTAFQANIICSRRDENGNMEWTINEAFKDILIPLETVMSQKPITGCHIECEQLEAIEDY